VTHHDRQKLRQLAELLIQHRSQLDYPLHDVRGPKDAETWKLTRSEMIERLNRGGRLCFDCSQSVTQLYRWTGLSDPSGLAYKHIGYTGTMLAHLPHYSDPRHCRVGALVVFGPGTGEHVAMVIEPDEKHGNPLLFSHGAAHLAGPIRLSVERTYHHAPVTLLNVSGL